MPWAAQLHQPQEAARQRGEALLRSIGLVDSIFPTKAKQKTWMNCLDPRSEQLFHVAVLIII